MSQATRHRILLVDDEPLIHDLYRTILAPSNTNGPSFELESALQGLAAVELATRALAEDRAYSVAFVDSSMPPGWNGARTIEELWRIDPKLQIVLCTGFIDSSREPLLARLCASDRLLILEKPFDAIEVQQLARALTVKWDLARQARQHVDELEALVERRTRDLATANAALESRYAQERETSTRLERALADLSLAHERARVATRAKSEFLANVSHEIRTPMSAILGYAELLREPNVAHEQRLQYIQAIRRSGGHLLAVINDLLDISRIEAGRMAVESERCAPLAVLAEVASIMRTRAAEKQLVFELDYDGPLPAQIQTDPRRLRQVLLNLVGNAIKFTETGSVRVVAHTDVKAARMRFDVIDTGIGIAPERQIDLFQPFGQIDGSNTRARGGAGLGLSISKRLAQMLGGDIDVASEVGRGSRFTVTIATGKLDGVRMLTAVNEAIAAAEVAANIETLRLDNLRVLLAEDGRDNQLLISFHLRKAGAQVTIEPDGERALATALAAWRDGRPFDVILTDMQMPGLDGYEVTRRLREEGYAGPIVALTAHALDGDRKTCLDAGCNEYLTKPVERDALVRVCAAMVAAARAKAA